MRIAALLLSAIALSACCKEQPRPTTPPLSFAAMGAQRVQPDYAVNQSYIVDGDGNADVTGDWIHTAGYKSVCFTIEQAATSAPAGTWAVQGGNRAADAADANVYLEENKVYGANYAAFTGGTTISVSSPAGAVVISFCIETVFPYTRLFWDSTSGGAVDTIDVSYSARAF